MDFRKTTIKVHLPKCSLFKEQNNYNLTLNPNNYNPYSDKIFSTLQTYKKCRLPPIYKNSTLSPFKDSQYQQNKLSFNNICNLSFDLKESYMKIHTNDRLNNSKNSLRTASSRVYNDNTVYLSYCTSINGMSKKPKRRSQSINAFHDTIAQFGKKFESFYSIRQSIRKKY